MITSEMTLKSNCCEWDVWYVGDPVGKERKQTAMCQYCKEWCTVIYEYNGEVYETLGKVVD
tara:strand:+ start:432 stop:614 length:183 start_codon:yes stop_codon:yes gene_type:complete